VDGVLWIALLVPQAQVVQGSSGPTFKTGWDLTSMRTALAGQIISVGVWVDSVLCGPDDLQQCPDPGTIAATLPVVWQIATGGFTGTGVNVQQACYDALTVEADTTAGFAQTGVWRLRLPQNPTTFGNWDAGSLGD